jgi:hypothetical protein
MTCKMVLFMTHYGRASLRIAVCVYCNVLKSDYVIGNDLHVSLVYFDSYIILLHSGSSPVLTIFISVLC